MKLHAIILSLWLVSNVTFASEIAKVPCPCGPVEHIFGKNIAKNYAEQHVNSGLIINDDNEGVPTNIIEALIPFGLKTQLIDKTGDAIEAQPIKDSQDRYLPMYQSDDFNLRKSIVATISINDISPSSQILEKLNKQRVINSNENVVFLTSVNFFSLCFRIKIII